MFHIRWSLARLAKTKFRWLTVQEHLVNRPQGIGFVNSCCLLLNELSISTWRQCEEVLRRVGIWTAPRRHSDIIWHIWLNTVFIVFHLAQYTVMEVVRHFEIQVVLECCALLLESELLFSTVNRQSPMKLKIKPASCMNHENVPTELLSVILQRKRAFSPEFAY